MDRIQATPRVRPVLGGLADMLAASYSPERTQQMQGLMQFLQVPEIAQTLDRISYGEPITTGRGMTTALRPEAKSTLGALLGLVPMGRAAEPVAMAAGRVLEPVAGRVAEAAYNRGGLAREMAMAMGQGTQSKIFIGPKSKAWDKASAEVAQKMEKDGSSARYIWEKTGTFKGPDGKWRQEISDQDINLRTQSFGKDRQGNKIVLPVSEGSASQVFEHPELYNAYPFTKKINTEIGKRPKTSGSAEYGVEGRFIEAYGPSDDEVKSALVHEMQHQIQDREGMSAGSNFIVGNENDFQRYLKAAGEAEARATQARRNMSMAQRRSIFPMDSYDVPWDELNVDSQNVRSLFQSLSR